MTPVDWTSFGDILRANQTEVMSSMSEEDKTKWIKEFSYFEFIQFQKFLGREHLEVINRDTYYSMKTSCLTNSEVTG